MLLLFRTRVEDAVLVMVQIPPSYACGKRKIAQQVLKQHGGVLPPEPASGLTMEYEVFCE